MTLDRPPRRARGRTALSPLDGGDGRARV